jgi:ribosomal protein S27E
MNTHTQVETKSKRVSKIRCQSPLNCGNIAVVWNDKEKKYLCSHCQEILHELQSGISVIFP